jgi:GNAT superfamily N-acetyltransferase
MHHRSQGEPISVAGKVSRKFAIRQARGGEADVLTALCHRSKRHWGYDDAFMALSAASLTVRPPAIADGHVFVAGDGDDPAHILGVAELMPLPDAAVDLDKLFVDPPAIGNGVGALLFRRAVAASRERGARRMTVLADPHAAAFYEKMGARFLRMAPSDAIPGRELPLFVFDIASAADAATVSDGHASDLQVVSRAGGEEADGSVSRRAPPLTDV